MNIKKIISIMCAVIMLVSLLANCFIVSAYTVPEGNEDKNQASLSMLNYYIYDGKTIDVGSACQGSGYYVSDEFSVLSNLTISGWVGHYRGVKSYTVSIICDGEKEILSSDALNASFRALTDEEFALACESVYMVDYNSQGNEKYKFNIDLTKSKFYGSGKDVNITIDAIIGTGFETNIVHFSNVHLTLLPENCTHSNALTTGVPITATSNNDGTHDYSVICPDCEATVVVESNFSCSYENGICVHCGYADPTYTPPEDTSETPPEDSSETPPEDSSEIPPEDTSEIPPEDTSEIPPEDSSEAAPDDSSESVSGDPIEDPTEAPDDEQKDIVIGDFKINFAPAIFSIVVIIALVLIFGKRRR